jgi:hypothetical protein
MSRLSLCAPLLLALLAPFACTGSDPEPVTGGGTTDGGASSSSGGGTSGGSTPACTPAQHACGGRCVDANDTTACGASCTPCAPPKNGTVACDGACKTTCNPGFAACGDKCVDIDGDSDNCGRCGRSCGNGLACTSGRCAAVKVSPLPGVTGLVIGPTNAYMRTPGVISWVVKSGGGTFETLAGTTNGYTLTDAQDFDQTSMAVDASSLYFIATKSDETAVYQSPLEPNGNITEGVKISGCFLGCALAVDALAYSWLDPYTARACLRGASCPTPTSYVLDSSTGEQAKSIAMHPNYWVWTNSGTNAVQRCARPGPCTSSTAIFAGTTNSKPTVVRVYKDDVYWLDVDVTAAEKARILSCPIAAGCGAAPKTIVSGELELIGLAVDETGVYYTVEGSSSAATGAVKVCRDLANGCGTAPEVLATAQPRAHALAIDDKRVYWSTLGVNGGAGEVDSVPK